MSDGDFLWKLIAVISNVTCLVAMFYSFRRKPTIPEELYKDFVSKGDLSDICQKRDQEIAILKQHNEEVHDKLFSLTRQMQLAHSEDLKVIERAVGKLEGIIEQIRKQ